MLVQVQSAAPIKYDSLLMNIHQGTFLVSIRDVNLSLGIIRKFSWLQFRKERAVRIFCLVKACGPRGWVYVRQGASSVPASAAAIRQMIKETDGDDFETIRSLEQNLTFQAMQQEFTDAGVRFGIEQMRLLGLIDGGGLFTNLALVLLT